MDEALDGLYAHDARADEDRGYDCKARASLGDLRAKRERDSQWHGGQGIAEVVDRSASRAMLPLAINTMVWARAASPRTASDSETARTPSQERLMLSCTSPWEWPCSC